MESNPEQRIPTNPALYKEVLVPILVGSMLDPIIGWFIGTFAIFFAAVAMDTSNIRGMRVSAFVGGLIGIPLLHSCISRECKGGAERRGAGRQVSDPLWLRAPMQV